LEINDDLCQDTEFLTNNPDYADYQKWIRINEPKPDELSLLKETSRNFLYRPKISIITPVWNTDERWLRPAIDSVIHQVYDNWELCIVDGGSTLEQIKPILEKYSKEDSRIKVTTLAENKGIAGNSNEALTLATGDFIGFLDHDDELAPFALYEIVKALNTDRNICYLYSDEDKIDEKNRRLGPYFKPDWSPDTLLSHNYLCHFSVVRKQIIDNIGGFHPGYDGSQDYDLFLRITEQLNDNEIFHIPKILYHWRMIPESASSSNFAKPYAYFAAKKALTDAMARRKVDIDCVIDGYWTGIYRIKYPIHSDPKISIIIPTKDNVKILKNCIESILAKTTYLNYEIVIVDNQSVNEETFTYYDSFKNCKKIKLLHYEKPFNFSAMNNFAVSRVDSPYVLFLNNDTEIITREWLTAMLEHAQRENIGAVGAKLLYPDATIQTAGLVLGIFGNPPVAGHAYRHLAERPGFCDSASIIRNVSAVTAACLLTKKSIFERIGGFDEKLAIAFNDVDLCLKLRDSGYLLIYTPYATIFHSESLSRGFEDTPEKQFRLQEEVLYIRNKWVHIFEKYDPYYNPNLTRNKEDFSINLDEP
jgi:GT2 family glycosyltransferase